MLRFRPHFWCANLLFVFTSFHFLIFDDEWIRLCRSTNLVMSLHFGNLLPYCYFELLMEVILCRTLAPFLYYLMLCTRVYYKELFKLHKLHTFIFSAILCIRNHNSIMTILALKHFFDGIHSTTHSCIVLLCRLTICGPAFTSEWLTVIYRMIGYFFSTECVFMSHIENKAF